MSKGTDNETLSWILCCCGTDLHRAVMLYPSVLARHAEVYGPVTALQWAARS